MTPEPTNSQPQEPRQVTPIRVRRSGANSSQPAGEAASQDRQITVERVRRVQTSDPDQKLAPRIRGYRPAQRSGSSTPSSTPGSSTSSTPGAPKPGAVKSGAVKAAGRGAAKPAGRVSGGATRVRGKARSVLRAPAPPTQPISLRATGDAVSQRHSRAVVDLSLRVGEAMLATGASVADTTAAVLRITRAYGLSSVHADITYTSITISLHRGMEQDPITVMRIVTRLSMDYARLERLHAMVREISAEASVYGEPGHVDDYLEELDFIVHQPHIYRRSIVTMGFAGMGVGVAILFGGSLVMVIIAALTTAFIDVLMHKVAKVGVSAFFGQMLGAMVAAGVAAVLLAARSQFPGTSWLWEIRPSLVVISGIVALLAGTGVVAAAQDTLDGFFVTAGARTYEVLMLTSGIVAGVLAMLSLAKQLGVQMYIVPNSDTASNLVTQIFAAAVISGSFAVLAYCGPRTTLIAVAIGGLSWLTFWSVSQASGFSQPIASGIAVFLLGTGAPWLARRTHVPSLAVTTASVVPLMPGLLVYRGIMQFVEDRSGVTAAPTLLEAALTGLALATGVSLGTLLGRQVMADETSVTAKVLSRTVADAE